MARLIWTAPALADLEEIAEYIALDNPEAASRYVRNVFDQIERLEVFPLSGRQLPEFPDSPYREVIVAPCRVIYRMEHEDVFVLHIVRSERLLHEFLLDLRDGEQ